MDIFEMLLVATAPVTAVKVIGVRRTTCIKGAKRTTLVCADGVNRVMHYRGSLAEAVPTGHITIMDISDEMNMA